MKPKTGDVYVNVPNSRVDGSRKVYCPLCYYDLREIPMVFDTIAQIWKCNYCKYLMSHHQNPVGDPKIAAGNDVETAKPYMRVVSFTKNLQRPSKPDMFSNPMDAYQSD